mmetsp:Transcript_105466/g.264061  ORF Transcript_105466/g.264061 Transcript_105466/m.264061 type:complete len:478 (+) Transcript_105466:1451-2884(+)
MGEQLDGGVVHQKVQANGVFGILRKSSPLHHLENNLQQYLRDGAHDAMCDLLLVDCRATVQLVVRAVEKQGQLAQNVVREYALAVTLLDVEGEPRGTKLSHKGIGVPLNEELKVECIVLAVKAKHPSLLVRQNAIAATGPIVVCRDIEHWADHHLEKAQTPLCITCNRHEAHLWRWLDVGIDVEVPVVVVSNADLALVVASDVEKLRLLGFRWAFHFLLGILFLRGSSRLVNHLPTVAIKWPVVRLFRSAFACIICNRFGGLRLRYCGRCLLLARSVLLFELTALQLLRRAESGFMVQRHSDDRVCVPGPRDACHCTSQPRGLVVPALEFLLRQRCFPTFAITCEHLYALARARGERLAGTEDAFTADGWLTSKALILVDVTLRLDLLSQQVAIAERQKELCAQLLLTESQQHSAADLLSGELRRMATKAEHLEPIADLLNAPLVRGWQGPEAERHCCCTLHKARDARPDECDKVLM